MLKCYMVLINKEGIIYKFNREAFCIQLDAWTLSCNPASFHNRIFVMWIPTVRLNMQLSTCQQEERFIQSDHVVHHIFHKAWITSLCVKIINSRSRIYYYKNSTRFRYFTPLSFWYTLIKISTFRKKKEVCYDCRNCRESICKRR